MENALNVYDVLQNGLMEKLLSAIDESGISVEDALRIPSILDSVMKSECDAFFSGTKFSSFRHSIPG